MFSFDVDPTAPQFDTSSFRTIRVFVTFENVENDDQNLIENATLHYFKNLSGDVSCIVDRFDCYPANPGQPVF